MGSNEENADIVDGGPNGEIKSVKARKEKVTEALSSLGIHVKKGADPPVIAVLGSGGGLRAMIGFLGVLSKMSELNLLGAITYIAGISGSTWCMSSLYSKKDWTDFSSMKDLERQLCDQIKHETERHFSKQWKRLKEKVLNKSYSLTDVWAYMFVCSVTNSITEEKLSNHKHLCENGENPYPIYCAVQKDKLWAKDSGAWFEFTPHLSGFPAHNSFIKTEHVGSKFEGGCLLEKQPENDLSYLQGMWGSAPAGDWITLFIKEIIKAIKGYSNKVQKQSKRFMRKTAQKLKGIYLLGVILLYPKNLATPQPAIWKSIKSWIFGENLEVKQPQGKKRRMFLLKKQKRSVPGLKKVLQSMKTFMSEAILYLLTLLKETYETAIVLKNILICLSLWKWGTVNNFLYHCKHKIPEDCDLFKRHHICLIDGGIEINTPYPIMLPPHRKVDLILSFDFSQGNPFLTLKSTAEYCEQNQIPFPAKTDEECYHEEIPTKSCYIFKGDGNRMPNVMHFPLFNTWTGGDKENVHKLRHMYRTTKLHYAEPVLTELLQIAKDNVESSINQIQERIKECVQRCNQQVI